MIITRAYVIGTYNSQMIVFATGARSSVDRVLASEAKGRRFDSCRAHHKAIAISLDSIEVNGI